MFWSFKSIQFFWIFQLFFNLPKSQNFFLVLYLNVFTVCWKSPKKNVDDIQWLKGLRKTCSNSNHDFCHVDAAACCTCSTRMFYSQNWIFGQLIKPQKVANVRWGGPMLLGLNLGLAVFSRVTYEIIFFCSLQWCAFLRAFFLPSKSTKHCSVSMKNARACVYYEPSARAHAFTAFCCSL